MATASVSTKPWRVEYAKSATSSCENCKGTIHEGELMLGKMVQSSQFDDVLFLMWNHADCIIRKANQIKLVDDVEGLELLRWEDQQKIRKYVGGCGSSTKNSSIPSECSIDVSPTSRTTCKNCPYHIGKGQMRVSSKTDGQGVTCSAWYHARCFIKMFPSVQLDDLSGWYRLPDFHQAKLRSWVNNVPSTNNENEHEVQHKEVVHESTSKAGMKRKKDAIGILKSKVVKSEENVSDSLVDSSRNDGQSGSRDVKVAELGSKLKAQSKEEGRSAMHESSGMQDSGHILEDPKGICKTTLHVSDSSAASTTSAASNLVTLHSTGVEPSQVRGVTLSTEQTPVSTPVSHRRVEIFTLLKRGAHDLMKGKDLSSVTRFLDLEIKENAHPSMMILLTELREISEKIRGIDLEKTSLANKSTAADLAKEKKLFEDQVRTTKVIEERRVQKKAEVARLEEQIRALEEQIQTIQTERQKCLRVEEKLNRCARSIDEYKEQSAIRMSKLSAKLEEAEREHNIKSGIMSALVKYFDTLVASLFQVQSSPSTKDAPIEFCTK